MQLKFNPRKRRAVRLKRAKQILGRTQGIKHLLAEATQAQITQANVAVRKAIILGDDFDNARRGTLTVQDIVDIVNALDMVDKIYTVIRKSTYDLKTALLTI